MANELRAPPGLNFGAFQPDHRKPGVWFKLASAATGWGPIGYPIVVAAVSLALTVLVWPSRTARMKRRGV